MCSMFEDSFSGVKCRPEAITEGGVELTEWPGKDSKGYKTFRFISSQNYPRIDNDTPDDASFVLSRNGRVAIKLKAFEGAPAFSDEELSEFRRIFTSVVPLPDGWRVKVAPSAKSVNDPRNW